MIRKWKKDIGAHALPRMVVALLTLWEGKPYYNWKNTTVCREAAASLSLFLLDWAAERSERGEKETNPAIVYGKEAEIEAAIKTLSGIERGQLEDVPAAYESPADIFWQLLLIRHSEQDKTDPRRLHGGL